MSLPRLAVLFSGGGRTLENLARKVVEGSLPMEIVLAISSHPQAGGIRKALDAGFPTEVVDYREQRQNSSTRLVELIEGARADWIALAGFVRHFDFPKPFGGRILNIHPALLPSFGGKGFYGEKVHRAVLESGAKFSGCTVHFVNHEYDRGPIILQRVVPVHPDDTVETLAARVFEEECIAYPEAIRLCAEGRVVLEGGRALVRGTQREEFTPQAR